MTEPALPTRVTQNGNRLTVIVGSRVDASSLSEIERQLLPQLTGSGARSDVLFDLQAVRTFDFDMRAALLSLHSAVAKQARRTVYLATRAHIRGLALWLIHSAGDPAASVAMNLPQAEAWLLQGKERVTWALERTEAALSTLAGMPAQKGGRP